MKETFEGFTVDEILDEVTIVGDVSIPMVMEIPDGRGGTFYMPETVSVGV